MDESNEPKAKTKTKTKHVKKSPLEELEVLKLTTGKLTCYVRGISPLIYNTMSEKAKRQLLYPKKKTQAERAMVLKHNPPEEFRDSVSTSKSGPTLLVFPTTAFKRALASAALDIGGAKKTQVDRLTWAPTAPTPIYGIPQLRMDVVTLAGMTGAPDIRTRAILTEWACKIDVFYVTPMINQTVVANLLAAAGYIRGIGDFRQEKGAGSYGQYLLVNEDDEDWHRIVETGGRAAQEEALANPVCYGGDDGTTERLYSWWLEEVRRRGQQTIGVDDDADGDDVDDDSEREVAVG